MTADVPTAQPRVAGKGIVTLARLSGRPIIPVAAATSRFFTLKTWSRMTVNLPFSKLVFVAGEPLFVPANSDAQMLELTRREVERSLNNVTARAYALTGAKSPRAVAEKFPETTRHVAE
jgi:3-deoxy-D-manno-octulosonic-acid transferase